MPSELDHVRVWLTAGTHIRVLASEYDRLSDWLLRDSRESIEVAEHESGKKIIILRKHVAAVTQWTEAGYKEHLRLDKLVDSIEKSFQEPEWVEND